MTTYENEAEANAAGFTVQHAPHESRFVLRAGEREIGEAHYTLSGERTLNFDHTLVLPEFRGTGLSGVLARHALGSDFARSRALLASCWFMAQYLRAHPELLPDVTQNG